MSTRAAPLILLALLCIVTLAKGDVPATSPAVATAPSDPELWREMTAVNELGADITRLTADFEQRKFTALLRKPIVSTGRIVARDERVLSVTERPEPSRVLVDAAEIKIYYPGHRVMEVYPIDKDLGALASSPLPKLDVLKRFFTFDRMAAKDLDPSADDASHLAVRLTPSDATLAEHVEEVRVLLDRKTGLVNRVETLDPDGDRNVITFANVRTGDDVTEEPTLEVPPGTKVSRPLERMK